MSQGCGCLPTAPAVLPEENKGEESWIATCFTEMIAPSCHIDQAARLIVLHNVKTPGLPNRVTTDCRNEMHYPSPEYMTISVLRPEEDSDKTGWITT